MPKLHELLPWIEKLTGLDAGRVERSLQEIASWPVEGLVERVGRPTDIDTAVRAVLLVDAVQTLRTRGVEDSKLFSKLRDLGQFESTWAELRTAAILVQTTEDDARVELESGKAAGAHADMRVFFPEGNRSSIEIKAVGLSDEEAEFCKRMNSALDRIIPTHGMVTMNSPLDGKPPKWTPQHTAAVRLDAARAAVSVPQYPRGLSAATIVPRGAEPNYVRRAASRALAAVRQLPSEDDCWVALHWSNGAPIDAVAAALDWEDFPAHVQGLLFVGSVVAFPHANIHNFVISVPRGFEPGNPMTLASRMDVPDEAEEGFAEEFARIVLERTEASSGVRVTLVRGEIKGKRRQLLRRDGAERILPFVLILDRDRQELHTHR